MTFLFTKFSRALIWCPCKCFDSACCWGSLCFTARKNFRSDLGWFGWLMSWVQWLCPNVLVLLFLIFDSFYVYIYICTHTCARCLNISLSADRMIIDAGCCSQDRPEHDIYSNNKQHEITASVSMRVYFTNNTNLLKSLFAFLSNVAGHLGTVSRKTGAEGPQKQVISKRIHVCLTCQLWKRLDHLIS